MRSYAQAEISGDPGDNDAPYVYAVEIEFGSFAFYYDWGTWNVNTFSYDADASSTYPAADTVPGKAGWYSFDGVNNKIKVTNKSVSTTSKLVKINIQYSTEGDSFDNFPLQPGCINMDFYDDRELLSKVGSNNNYTFDMEKDTSREIYLSISGEPILPGGEPYMSATAHRIGYIVLSVDLAGSSDPETGN